MFARGGGSLSRRKLLDFVLGGGVFAMLGGMLYPVVRYLVPRKAAAAHAGSVRVAGAAAELKPNSGRLFRFGNSPAILIRTPSGEFRAFSAVCTHLGCTVQYRDDLEHIWCACHNGHYDLSGRNIAGPPPRPLEAYGVAVREKDVFVSRKA